MTAPPKIEHSITTRYHVARGRRAHIGDFTGERYANGEPWKTVCGQFIVATFVDPFWTPVLCKKCAAWDA